MVPVNYLAVVLSAIWAMVVGSIWYGPLFGKPWMKMMGMTREKMKNFSSADMAKLYGMQLVGSLAMAFVLSHSLYFSSTWLEIEGVNAGLSAGFWNWLGFVAPVTLTTVLWEGKPWKLWLLNNGNYLVTLLGMGVILSLL